MKKLYLTCIACGIVLAGCEPEENNFPIANEVVKAESSINFLKVPYKMSAITKDNDVNVQLSLENNNSFPIPILLADQNLFSVKLKKEDGTVVEEQLIERDPQRDMIQKQEKLEWNVHFKGGSNERLVVETQLLLKGDNDNKIELVNEVQTKHIKVNPLINDIYPVSFAPNKEKRYEYQTEDGTVVSTEVFKIFNKNKIQSVIENNGLNIISIEGDGIYKKNITDSADEVDITDSILKEDMEKILPMPITKGISWDVNNKHYILSEESIKVATPIGDFEDAVEVTEIDGDSKKFYYYQKDIGLIKVKKYIDDSTAAQTEMQLAKIEEL
ncbi:hypothetical protein [Bacillus toyonensis]|uniref:hypothetical protein n=1 Tax=Bacillus toyonensis TaxID=155322 RepID=UPI002E23203E|nr:hypothetical protein [Bacillus toyonensis]